MNAKMARAMRTRGLVLVLLCSCLTACSNPSSDALQSGSESTSSADENEGLDGGCATLQQLSETLVDALRRKDAVAYVNLCGTREDTIELVEASELPDSEKEAMIADMKSDTDAFQRIGKMRRRNFLEIADHPAWKDATVAGVTPGDKFPKPGIVGYAEIDISFVDGVLPDLEVDLVAKASSGWKIYDDVALAINLPQTGPITAQTQPE